MASRRSWISIVGLALIGAACSGGQLDPEHPGADAEALRVEGGRHAVAYEYAHRNDLIHGIAGDERYVFVTEALSGNVPVLSRDTGVEVGALPPPPDGFLLPFALRVPETGRLFVLDSGGFPDPERPAIPRVYEYAYETDPRTKAFSATLVRGVKFDGLPVIYAEDMEVLPDGRIVVSESVIGALWVVNTDFTVEPALFPAGFDPDQAIPGLNPCVQDPITVGDVPFSVPGGFAPGVGSMAARGDHLYFGNTCLGGIRRIPIAALTDPSKAPHERGDAIEVVSPRPAGTEAETLKGLTFNRWSNDDRLIATDPIHLRLLRIDIRTGKREVLADDPMLFNFPVAAQWLPPTRGRQPLVVSSDQEHRLAALNIAIPGDMLQLPFIVTKVYPKH